MDKTECCPKFNPTPWDDKIFSWNEKKFIKGNVFTLFYMPINFGSAITGLIKKIGDAGAKMQDWLCLSDHTSSFNMDIYLAVDKEIPNANNTTISGKFYSKVYEGSFGDTGTWCKDFEGLAKSKGIKLGKMYMWYTTCPKCAKKWGKNYVVIISQIIG